MGTANSSPSSGVAGLEAQYGGGGLSEAISLTDPFAMTVDYDVRVGREQRTPGKDEFTGAELDEFLYGGMPSNYTRTFPVNKKASEVNKQLYSMPDEDVAEIQRRLWAGGFYPPGTKPDEIALGDRDPYTDAAWRNAVERTGNFNAAGRDLTLDEVIDMGANLRGGAGLKDGSAGGSGRQPLVVELANPEDLKYYAQKTAVATLGRSLKPDELNRFVSSFQSMQTTSQTQAYNAAGGAGGNVVGAPSPQVAAEAFARQTDPTAAGAHDVVRVFDKVSQMLGGKRGRA